MYQVKGKWALITGAARGIGYLTAKFMAGQGCNLILHSRDLSHTEKVLREVSEMGVEARAVAADLNDADAVKRMLEEIDRFGVLVRRHQPEKIVLGQYALVYHEPPDALRLRFRDVGEVAGRRFVDVAVLDEKLENGYFRIESLKC